MFSAKNGRECLRILESLHIPTHLLISYVVMPDMNRKEYLERLKHGHLEIKILFTSSYTDDEIVHHGVLDEGINFIQKPFTVRALAAKTRDILEARP